MSAVLRVTEYTDVACPWAWGSEPKLAALRGSLGPAAEWRRVHGILFDEGEEPAPDPDAEAAWYHGTLREIAETTGAPVPERLHWVARSSRPAALAAKAAERQGGEVADAVLRRLREAVFVAGRPADTPERVLAALGGVPGLDLRALADAAAGDAALAAVHEDWVETRAPIPEAFELTDPAPGAGRLKPYGDDEGFRYSFPTLLFEGSGGRFLAPGWRSAREYSEAALRAAPELASRLVA